MRLRYWTALVFAVGLSGTFAWREADQATSGITTPTADARVEHGALSGLADSDLADAPILSDRPNGTPPGGLTTWSRALGAGDNLDILLAEAGLDAPTRSEVSRAIGAEYDLRRLKPSYQLSLEIGTDGQLWSAALEVENGLRVLAVFGNDPSVRTIPPELETVTRAGEAEIASSIYAALETATIPTRFATDLELILDGTLDLRRAVNGGERLRMVWRENRLGDEVIGVPTIDFAEIDLGTERFEVIWPDDQSSHVIIYKTIRSFGCSINPSPVHV